MNREDIESSIAIFKCLKGYSERMGLFADEGSHLCCKEKSECPARECRLTYENSLNTAIAVLEEQLKT